MAQRQRTPTAEEILAFQEVDKQWRMNYWPPQIDAEGKVMLCARCRSPLHPLENRNYLATVGGYCDKLCRRAHEKKLMYDSGMTPQEASDEVDKYGAYKPIVEVFSGV